MYAGPQKHQLEANDPELAEALAKANSTGNDIELEKVVGARLKEMMEKHRKEQERIMRLRNADPNDAEAQKEIEEEIRKAMI